MTFENLRLTGFLAGLGSSMMRKQTGRKLALPFLRNIRTFCRRHRTKSIVSEVAYHNGLERLKECYAEAVEPVTDHDRVTKIRPDRFAEMVVEAGLTSWLLRKVS